MTESQLNAALREFEKVDANLTKLEVLWARISAATPTGIAFGEPADVENDRRAYGHVLSYLPDIDGKRPTTLPMSFDEIGQNRFDAAELGEIECTVSIEQAIDAPGRELRDYRFRFEQARRQLVRQAIAQSVTRIDDLLQALRRSRDYSKVSGTKIKSPRFEMLRTAVAELEMLLGKSLPKKSRWPDLQRHLNFGESNDLRDIVEVDWPAVKPAVFSASIGDNDPLPTQVTDLATLLSAKPSGAVATKLAWDRLDDEGFERLIFALVSSEPGYENPEWLMQVNAPDKGRDVSVLRVFTDGLGGTRRERVIVQCKNWRSRSVALADIGQLRDQAKLWEPPRIDALVVATTGRFTADAVALVEKQNQSDSALRIEMWPESHLERLLAARPNLIATYGLR